MINGNMVGGTAPIKTISMIDADNNELTCVVVENEVIFNARPEDVKIGKIFGLSISKLLTSNAYLQFFLFLFSSSFL